MMKTNSKTGNNDLFFAYGINQWQSLTNKCTGEILAPNTLRKTFIGLITMKSVLSLDEIPLWLGRSISAASKLKSELPTDLQLESILLKKLSSLLEDTYVKTREAFRNTDHDMREFLGTNKGLQSIQIGLLNNTSKLTETHEGIKRDTKNLEEAENDSTYTDEQRQLYKDRLDDLNPEKQARLEILSQDQKFLQTQDARIKQTLEKVLDKNTPLLERFLTLIREQIVTIISTRSTLSSGIAIIVLSVRGDFEGGGRTGVSPPKDEGVLKNG